MWNDQASRAVTRVLLVVGTGIVVSWLGLAALVTLSVLWPANQVPHVLLGVWLCVIVATLVVRLLRTGLSFRDTSWLWQMLFAPFDPIFQIIRRPLGL
jgi:predicted membrane protein